MRTVYIYTFAGDKANKLLLKIFEMYFVLSNPFTTPVYASFKVREGITEADIEGIIYDLENILSQDATEAMLDSLTESFKKNKFMEFLPENVRGSLKMDIIFDKKGLIESQLIKVLISLKNQNSEKLYLQKGDLNGIL